MKSAIEFARSFVRPYLAYAFGTALIAAAFLAGPDKAFELMKEPALLVIGFYVGSRASSESK